MKTVLTHQERCDLKESLRIKYMAITDFEEKFLFWQAHNLNLRYWNNIERTREILKTDNSFEKANLTYLNDEEDRENGIYKPEPSTDREKAIVAKWHIDNEQKMQESSLFPILTFEVYKAEITYKLNNIDKIEDRSITAKNNDKVKVIKRELNLFNSYLDSISKNNNIILVNNLGIIKKITREELLKDEKLQITISSLIETMLIDGKINYSQLYDYNKHSLKFYYFDELYVEFAKIITPIQFKRYLEDLLNQQEVSKSDLKLSFDNKILENFMPKLFIDRFIEFENELIEYTWFDENGKWKREKIDLTALILLFIEKNIFSKNHKINRKKITQAFLRDFFMERYKCQFDESFFGKLKKQPQKIDSLRNELNADNYKSNLLKN